MRRTRQLVGWVERKRYPSLIVPAKMLGFAKSSTLPTSYDTHHTADDTLDKIDPKELAQAVAVWSAFAYLAAASDVDFRSLAATAK
jgi:hypothetical protein